MNRDTVAIALQDLDKPRMREEWQRRILQQLPADLKAPIISNASERCMDGKPGAWLSFRRDYGETWTGADMLDKLEAAGFKPLPVTLAQYGNYRRSAHPGFQHQIPETSSREELKDCEPIAPVWIVPNQFTESEAITFYQMPDGLIVRVLVPAPNTARISAKRIEYRGGWRYERGTARLHYPDSWHSVYISEEAQTPISQVCVHSRAYVDTEQGISGAIYFTPFLDHGEFPLSPAQFLRRLEEQK